MARISNRFKLGLSIGLLLVLAVLLLFGSRQGREKGGVSWENGKEILSVFLSESGGEEAFLKRYEERKDKRMTYQDLMELAELFSAKNLLKKEALVTLEQQISQWEEHRTYATELELKEFYVLCAEYSCIPELVGRYDVVLFGEKGSIPDPGALKTSLGLLSVKETQKALLNGYSYSVILEGSVITEVLGYAREKITLSNAWIVKAEGSKLTVFYEGFTTTLSLEQPLAVTLNGVVADVTLAAEYVAALAVKNNVITAKVLRTGKDCVELEGYGTLYFEDDFRIYKIYEELEEEQTASILVGYTATSFAISGTKISAALITEPVQATNIRVLIQNSSYGGYYHEHLPVTSDCRFYVSDGTGNTVWHEAGERVDIRKEEVEAAEGRLYLGTEKESGKLKFPGIQRAAGNPSYRGTMEVALSENGLLLVNELSIEEYLYGVLPSEMPASFGVEALKAQAVCARSYAYKQLLANRFHQYGAHVDDSMVSQVYMNYGENETAIFAVKDTFGKILTQDGECVTAFYFSCSYGHTSDSEDVWGVSEGYLSGKRQTEDGGRLNLTKESDFQKFFKSAETGADGWYDGDAAWFRWNTTFAGSGIEDVLYERLRVQHQASPDQILKKKTDADGTVQYVSEEIKPLGTLLDIAVAERGESGIVTKLLIAGSKETYLVMQEYHIRKILAPLAPVTLADGNTADNMTLLPSAYIYVKKQGSGYMVYGGGYGHGVGMSQYGARAMAARGKDCGQILAHFYPGTELTYLYR